MREEDKPTSRKPTRRVPIEAMPLVVSVLLSLHRDVGTAQAEDDPLKFRFTGKYGQIEVGGRYAGAEFHRSRPAPSRLSFYYPVANSIDLSTDYWKREESLPLVFAIRTDGRPPRWVSKEPWDYTLQPHRVSFDRVDRDLRMSVDYEFCASSPAMVVRWTATNMLNRSVTVEFYTHLRTVLRTCQTYARVDSAIANHDERLGMITASFRDPATAFASLFVLNAAKEPDSWTADAREFGIEDDGHSDWEGGSTRFGRTVSSGAGGTQGVAAFMYSDTLSAGESMTIVHVIGTSPPEELGPFTKKLKDMWELEVEQYSRSVTEEALRYHFATGNSRLDRSATWSRALMETNAHWLDGTIVPMPCPAEYNFFFTHDLLQTDLGAVYYDHERVKRDLLYVASHAKDDLLPHAYYWRDDGFKTEYCGPDNWNHLWFILVSAAYLRLSNDTATVSLLYPILTRSVNEVLTQKRGDDLMYAKHPDWWDIGNNEGPRSYLTILAIRGLREYAFVSAVLRRRLSELQDIEASATATQRALNDRLWSDTSRYLMNENNGVRDPHYYAGSLLAPVYGLLEGSRGDVLVATANRLLVDPKLGTRTVSPADFHTDSLISYFRLLNNEAGRAFAYLNGGIWPHTTAWYILALNAIGKTDEALTYFERTMTIDGIASSPGGTPALYEYRFADTSKSEYGAVDKPSFLWAGGKYLEVLYTLFGVHHDEWNVSFTRPHQRFDTVRYSLALGSLRSVTMTGEGRYLESLSVNGVELNSAVVPIRPPEGAAIQIRWGEFRRPYVKAINAILLNAKYEDQAKRLTVKCSSYPGHETLVDVMTGSIPRIARLDGKDIDAERIAIGDGTPGVVRVAFAAESGIQELTFEF